MVLTAFATSHLATRGCRRDEAVPDRGIRHAASVTQHQLAQTLNRNSITSPSETTYSLPSLRSQPRLRASANEPASSSCS